MTGSRRVAAAVLLLSGLAAPADAGAIIKVMPASAATGFPFSSSYRLSLLDLAAGAEVNEWFALAGGAGALDYYGSSYGEPTALPLPVYGYVLMSSEEADYNNRFVPYAFLGAYPLAIPRYQAIVGTGGLGASWNFYVATVGAEFRTVFWHEPGATKTTYLLQLTLGLGGWYALGGERSDSWFPR